MCHHPRDEPQQKYDLRPSITARLENGRIPTSPRTRLYYRQVKGLKRRYYRPSTAFFRTKMASEPSENDAVAITTAAANTAPALASTSTPQESTDSVLSALSNGNADGSLTSADEKMSALLQKFSEMQDHMLPTSPRTRLYYRQLIQHLSMPS